MGQYAGINTSWVDNIYQFEQTDVVLGGPDGIDNIPLQQLADRTAWLREQIGVIGRFSDVAEINTNTIVNEDFYGKVIAIDANNKSLTITIASPSNFIKGTLLTIVAYNVNKSQVTIQTTGGIRFIDLDNTRTKMYMGSGDKLWIVVGNNVFYILDKRGNFDRAGEPFWGHKDTPNSLRLIGQPVNIIDYPRLGEYAVSLGTDLLADTVRMSVNAKGQMPYKGAFSRIDANTIRLPDFRGMEIRALDLGAGIDYGRLWERPGGYEPDAVGSHLHLTKLARADAATNGDGAEENKGGNGPGWLLKKERLSFNDWTDENFGSAYENRVKTIGLIPFTRV